MKPKIVNSRNGKPMSSRYHGVSRKPNGKWLAQLNRDGRFWYGGRFEKEEDAAAAVVAELERRKEQILESLRKPTPDIKTGELICPACGRPKLIYRPWRKDVVCGWCTTEFTIERIVEIVRRSA